MKLKQCEYDGPQSMNIAEINVVVKTIHQFRNNYLINPRW